jgi:hypothetical protein
MNPVVLWKNSSGVWLWSHSWMNWAALLAPFGVIGPLLPMKPQARP